MTTTEKQDTSEALVDAIAHVCHTANRGLQAAFPAPGIPIAGLWEDIDEEMRESARDGVRNALAGASAEELHQGWLDFKDAAGWTYGPVKNDATKEHPCMVPYAELPEASRIKDSLFQAVVATLKDMPLSEAPSDEPETTETPLDEA